MHLVIVASDPTGRREYPGIPDTCIIVPSFGPTKPRSKNPYLRSCHSRLYGRKVWTASESVILIITE